MSESNKMEGLTSESCSAWNIHTHKAIMKFLKTAVIIDNQPWIRTGRLPTTLYHDSGMDGPKKELTPPTQEHIDSPHDLDLRSVSDIFSEKGISCAFVLPDDSNNDRQQKINRALLAAKNSDLVVIDWYLESNSSGLTLQILQKIAENDSNENGRLRLICVYTGESLTSGIFSDIKKSLSSGGVTVSDIQDEVFCAQSKSTIIILRNKEKLPANELPDEVIRLFSRFANGLVPSFALAAVGAIRRNTHHMLTRFSQIIDYAYISNRLITNPPGDVAELMRDLIVAECDNALGLERIADEYLENEAINLWLDKFASSIKATTYKSQDKEIAIDRSFIDSLLKAGIDDNGFQDINESKVSFPEKKRFLISEVLSGSKEKSKNAQDQFSRLVAFRRESYGSTTRIMNHTWLPSLTTGSVLRYTSNNTKKYLMCFTPACDTLRITEKSRPFVFIEGVENPKRYNFVISSQNGENIGISFEKKHPIVHTFMFTPDIETQRVRARKVSTDSPPKFYFDSSDDISIEFEWLGEIRYNRATSEMASIANTWMRIGILDSEYLRLAARGQIKN
ncbi:response regulator receiver domain [Mangrovibacter phragmitis]|uniref:response regulator receiver domain n=1 Tax=Mangrovibacter phragmitis TaxID=1691903 RepID=UPI00351392F3